MGKGLAVHQSGEQQTICEPIQSTGPFQKWHDATVIGPIRSDVLNRRVSVAFGRSREDKNWKTATAPFGNLLESLVKFEEGGKDGKCLLQGALVGPQRIAKNVKANHLMMFDLDTGEDMTEIAHRIEDAELFAMLWTTHSHLKSETEIPEAKILTWMKEQRRSGAVTADTLVEYLRSTAKVRPEILEGATEFKRDIVEGGVRYFLRHKPMPRIRVMFLLKDPFEFANRGGSQAEAIQEWKERYAGVATAFGFAYDRSCVDPSRLMYTPRIPAGAALGRDKHEILIIDGEPLDIEQYQRVEVDRKGARGVATGVDAFAALGTRRDFKTAGLAQFLAEYGDDFEAAEWVRAMSPEDVRDDSGGKIDARCPNEDGHSNPRPDDRAFMVVDASSSEAGSFHMGCLHDGCKVASGGDRAWYLDQLCQQYGVTHARELEDWCPRAAERRAEAERATLLGRDQDGLEAAVAALGQDSPVAEVEAVLRAIATREPGLVVEDAITAVAERTGRRRADVARAVRQHAKSRPADGDGDVPREARHPVPDDPEQAQIIWAEWDYNDQCRAVEARLAYLNAKDPTLFCRREGGVVRVEEHDGRVLAGEMNGPKWHSELSRRLEFRRIVEEQERGVEPFKPIVTFMVGNARTPYPILDRITHVPVFGPDGSLRWEKGYDEALQVYVCPNFEPRPVPDVVDAEDVNEALWWLEEALRDFPFSDTFDGSDTLPVKLDEVDGDGFRVPNMERGVSSRTNAFAMILQPFVRSMIDGPCPAYHIDKSSPGTGAGYLVDVAYVVAEGTRAVAQTMSESNEEFRKNITATIREGASIIFVDNINRRVDSGDLASALTAGVWRDRILGESRVTTIPIKAMWILAGNNLSFSHELMRRNVPIRLDAAVPNPTRDRGRKDFKHFPLQPWLFENRADLVWACHVVVRNWIQKGMQWGSKTMHSFDAWAGVMSGIMESAGLPGFLDNVDRYLGEKDEDEDIAGALAQLCFEKYGMKPMRAMDIIAATKGTFGEAVIELPIRGNDDRAMAQSLSGWMKREMEGRTFVVSPGGVTQGVTGRISVTESDTSGDTGDTSGDTNRKVKLIRRRVKRPVVWELTEI